MESVIIKSKPEPLLRPRSELPNDLDHSHWERAYRPYWLFSCTHCGAAPGEFCVLPSGKLRTTVFFNGKRGSNPHQNRFERTQQGQWIAVIAYDVGFGLSEGDEVLLEKSLWSARFRVVKRLSDGYDPMLVLEGHEAYYLREATREDRK